jgi:hypothetical protein
MKKTFKLTNEKIKPERLVEAIKHEIRKYLKRERKRDLPKGMTYWDFDCRFGDDAASSNEIHLSEIDKFIDRAVAKELESFYLEILAKPVERKAAAKPVDPQDEEDSEED